MLRVEPVGTDLDAVSDLIGRHYKLMRDSSPEGSCHALTVDELKAFGACLFRAINNRTTVGVGALVKIEPTHGEVKSIHVLSSVRRNGVGRAILNRLIDEAQSIGWKRLSLETGSCPTFGAARALFASVGFCRCAPFGSYQHDPLSEFMSRRV